MMCQPFTRNHDDNSTEAGFQFTFRCDICNDGYRTQFIASKTYKKAGFFKGLGQAASIGTSILGTGYNLGQAGERAADTLAQRFDGMSADWHEEHERAFELAQNEAIGHFHRCPKCYRYVCKNDWNEDEGLCVEDAPRLNVEIAAAKSRVQAEQVKEKAQKTAAFAGEIESKQTICPGCGKPVGQGKFCSNCGTSLVQPKCSKCGLPNAAGSKFCSECGARLA